MLVEDGDDLHGASRLVPHDELLIASDHAGGAEAHADHVPGVHRPSVALAQLTVRGQGERALDVATGNGIQAILLASHAEHVVATDVNPRALAYARFNAALNGIESIETREGSFFEPVAGEQFDLVVVNPPYVVSPESAYLFRDSGMRGDAVSEHVVRAAPAVLAPGGFASILIAWALDPDDPAARPRGWLEGSGCDALLLHTSTDDPVETAMLWNRELLDRPEDYADALDRWLAYYRELGIEQLGYACVVLRGARTAARAGSKRSTFRAPRCARRRAHPAAVRDARPAARVTTPSCSTGGCGSPRTPSSRRSRASRKAPGTRSCSRSGSRRGCRSPPSSTRRLRGSSAASTARGRCARRSATTRRRRPESRSRARCSRPASSSSPTRRDTVPP